MLLTREEIKRKSNGKTYQRGMQLKKQGAIFNIREREEQGTMHVRAVAEGSMDIEYFLWMDFDLEKGEILEYECQCPAYFQYEGMCKHCVALALHYVSEEPARMDLNEFLRGQKQGGKKVSTSNQISEMIYDYAMEERAGYLQPDVIGQIELEPKLHRDYKGWSVEFKIGAKTKYVLKDLHAFLEAMEKKEKVDYGKKLGFIHEVGAFTRESRELVAFLGKYVGEYRYHHGAEGFTRYYYFTAMRALGLSGESLGALLHLLTGKQILLDDYYAQDKKYVEIVSQDPLLPYSLERLKGKDGFLFTIPAIDVAYGNKRLYVRYKDTFYECSQEFSRHMRRICEASTFKQDTKLQIGKEDMPSFCSTILPVLQEYANWKAEVDLEEYQPKECVVKIYLDWEEGVITARLEAEYGDATYNLLDQADMLDTFRNTEREAAAVHMVSAYFPGVTKDKKYCFPEAEEDLLYHLITTGVEQIGKAGELYASDAFKKLRVDRAPRVSIGISLSGGLIDLEIDSGHLSAEDLEGFLNNYRKRKKYYRLKNGTFLEIEDNSVSMLSEITDGLELSPKELGKGKVQVPKYRAFYLNQVLKEESEGVEVFRDQAFKSVIRDMKSIEDSDHEVPESLKNILRAYQKTGFRWLCTLDDMGFCGILADDMGLGKTLQVLAYLLHKKEQSGETEPSLIVCPASLVYNWQSEIQHFTPELSQLVLAGTLAERKKLLEEYQDYDVVITSYDLLKRDIELYADKKFSVQIIDEAQNIKNHATQAAKAVKSMEAPVKFALTGTPIENRLSELWSIFDYLMPGFLAAYERFKTDYEAPIVQNQDPVAISRLQRMIKPFILRRIKADVLKDLPDKEENIIYSKMEGEQKALYAANVQRMRNSLSGQSDEEVTGGKLQILAELTRLRQICCAPGMVYENYKGDSAKLDTCMELIRNALEGGHKILIFSQFTSLFELMEERLKKDKIQYYKLTGSTPKQKRMQLVREFNDAANDTPLFLISLKAGGTGLNLTAADIVIHFDPWWNIAAQNQATDRAHRIGQTNTVSVFKLIAKDTIEEKIIELQEAKKNLSDQIISEKGISVSSLTKEDFLELLEP